MGCGRFRNGWRRRGSASAQTGNTAFDAYREETLRRLETEREAFTAFLDRLRKAKDQAEFDQFMAEQRNGGPTTGESGQGYSGPGGEPGPTPRTDAPGGGFAGASPYPA